MKKQKKYKKPKTKPSRPPVVSATNITPVLASVPERRPAEPRDQPSAVFTVLPSAAPPVRAAPARVVMSGWFAGYAADDRQALALLMLPFFILAFAIGLSQSMRWHRGGYDLARTSAPFARPSEPFDVAHSAVVTANETITSLMPEKPRSGAEVKSPGKTRVVDVVRIPSAANDITSGEPSSLAVAAPAAAAVSDAIPSRVTNAASPPVEIAAITPEEPTEPAPIGGDSHQPTGRDANNVCVAESPSAVVVRPERVALLADAASGADVDPVSFGLELAAAAREQLDDFTVYTDKYRSIAYPNGDVPQFYGVCTDVIIRAYRVLGIDLQALVHQSKLGSGDTNIDHRRVGTLQKFFAAYGQSLPVTDFSEDYWPGDVVSYYRPQNAHSRSHIAIVSDQVGPSGNFMIIHNRGWGPQQEDGLFVDQITGHYRYSADRRPATGGSTPGKRKTLPSVGTAQAGPASPPGIADKSAPPITR